MFTVNFLCDIIENYVHQFFRKGDYFAAKCNAM